MLRPKSHRNDDQLSLWQMKREEDTVGDRGSWTEPMFETLLLSEDAGSMARVRSCLQAQTDETAWPQQRLSWHRGVALLPDRCDGVPVFNAPCSKSWTSAAAF